MNPHLSNLEFVRRKCQEVNPSLLKLEFGCKINIQDIHFMGSKGITASQNPLVILTPCSDPNVYLVLTKIGIEHFKWRDIDLYCEILGKEPTFADCLNAVKEVLCSDKWLKENSMEELDEVIVNTVKTWNLLLPFSQQSEPTLAFLRSLLEQ